MKISKTITFPVLAVFAMALGARAAWAEDPDPAVMALGKTTYAICMACHNVDGKGLPIGTLKMAPPLAGSPYALGDPGLFALIILKGVVKEDAKFAGIMAPLEAALDDKKLSAVMTYVRNSFGNKAPAVTEDEVKAAREKYAKIASSVKRSTIEKLLEKSKKEAGAALPEGGAAAPEGEKKATE